ncbi:MAG: hypothetical protein ABL906_09155 [Sideroxydans sp.]
MTVVFALLWVSQSAIAAEIALPRPDHIVIVVEENRGYSKIIGNPDAPYINALAQRGVLFTNSYGVTHPSQPNKQSGTDHYSPASLDILTSLVNMYP